MNLVSSYVRSVKRYLPANIREDVAQELTGLLDEKLEAARERKGAELHEDDIIRILKDFGHPYQVAVNYFPIPTLISNKAYPLYRRTLVASLILHFLVALEISLLKIGHHASGWALVLFPDFLNDALFAVLLGFADTTIVFHYLGDYLSSMKWAWRWDPKKLLAGDGQWADVELRHSVTNVVTALFCLALLTVSSNQFAQQNVTIQVSDAALTCIATLRVVLVLWLLLYVVNMWQRHWTRLKLVFAAALGIVASVCLVWMALAPRLLELSVAVAEDAQRAAAQQLFTWWPLALIRIALLVIAGVIVRYIVRFVALAARKSQAPAW